MAEFRVPGSDIPLYDLQTAGNPFRELAGTRSYPAVRNRFAAKKRRRVDGDPPPLSNDRTPSVRKPPRPLCRSTSLVFSGASPGDQITGGYPHREAFVNRLCQLPSGASPQARSELGMSLQNAACRKRARADLPAFGAGAGAVHGATEAFAKALWRPPTTSSASRPLPPNRSSLTFPSFTAWNHLSAVPAA